MNCGKMCKSLIMNESSLLLENFKVSVAIIVRLDSSHQCKCNYRLSGLQHNTTSMAGSCVTQLSYVSLNIFLANVFVLASQDFCGNVFETQIGK